MTPETAPLGTASESASVEPTISDAFEAATNDTKALPEAEWGQDRPWRG